MYRLIALPVALVLALPAAAQEKTGKTDLAKAIAPYLDEQTIGVIHVDLGRIDLDAMVERFAKIGSFDKEQTEKAKEDLGEKFAVVRQAGVRDLFIVARMEGFPTERWAFAVLPLADGANEKAIIKQVKHDLHMPSARIGNAVVIGDEATLGRLKDLQPTPYPELAKGFAAVGGTAIQAVVLMPPPLRKAMEEALPNLPPEVGGGSIQMVTRNVTWKAVGVNLTPELGLKVVVQTKNAQAAKELAKLADTILDALAKDPGLKKAFPDVAAVREMFSPKVKGSQLTLALDDKELVAFLAPALARVKMASRRAEGSNNLKQMALAMHNYHDAYKGFPAHASYDKQDRPLLSWRVHILPFIEQQDLYRQFHLDEPWDSEHNKKLIARMPQTYRSPSSKAGPGKTVYLVPVGKDTIFPPGPKGLKISDIPDGTSNTLLIVEADDKHAVIWTRPDDLVVDPKQPLRGLGGKAAGRFLAAFADGSVRAIARTIDLDTLRALFTRNGGEAVGDIP
jgi:hypothetical protein